MIKIYADASLMHGSDFGGIGIVFVDESDVQSFAKSVFLPEHVKPSSVVYEMIAVYCAVVLFNRKDAIVYTDCLTAINYINCKGGHQLYQMIAKKIRKIAKRKNITFKHINKRPGNKYHKKADRLSKIKSGAIK